ncbi:MAG: serine/threonine-protein kinase [Fimbriiglobus sp.]
MTYPTPTLPDSVDPVDPLPAVDLTGRTVGDFHVLRKLGAGGMGQVYLARQLSLKRDVALKILRDELAANPTALKRFQAEAEAVARVTHANIVQVYAVGEDAGLRYMALEYVAGRTLKDYLIRKGPPDLPVALAIIRQIAAALQRASELGLVHRDIKPENILVTRKTEVKVADFGLSRFFAPPDGRPLDLTQSGMTLGTPLYMSPEQVQGHPVDHRSDIYSFGVTCYHLLGGQPPFRGATPFEVAIQHVQADPAPLAEVRPDLPPDLCAMVHRMMAKLPADRYQTARDVIRDVAKLQKGLPVGLPISAASGSAPVLPPTSPNPSPTAPRIGQVVVAGTVVAVLAAVGWAGYGLTHPPAAPPAETAAIPGLPADRPPVPVIPTRERELVGVLASRSSKPLELLDAAVELGLLYVRDRRFDEAEKVFREMDQDRPGPKFLLGPAVVAGRLGQAIVLAYRDKPKESNELFERTVTGPPRPTPLVVNKFLVDHPDFAQAVAEALTRNAENLGLPKLPDRLEWLRTPAGSVRGPKGG